jgi:hypothetical protein
MLGRRLTSETTVQQHSSVGEVAPMNQEAPRIRKQL